MWNRAKTVLMTVIIVVASLTVYFSLYLKATINQTRTAGVNVGNRFRYNVTTTSWGAYYSNSTILSPHEDEAWVEISIIGISGTNITGTITRHYWNGTEIALDSWADVATGDGTFGWIWQFLLFRFISPNLTAGDTLWKPLTETINETVPTTYPSGAVRDTNQLITIYENSGGGTHPPMYNSTITYSWYWDRVTGVIVDCSEQNLYYFLYGEQANHWAYWSVEYRIISSDLWAVS